VLHSCAPFLVMHWRSSTSAAAAAGCRRLLHSSRFVDCSSVYKAFLLCFLAGLQRSSWHISRGVSGSLGHCVAAEVLSSSGPGRCCSRAAALHLEGGSCTQTDADAAAAAAASAPLSDVQPAENLRLSVSNAAATLAASGAGSAELLHNCSSQHWLQKALTRVGVSKVPPCKFAAELLLAIAFGSGCVACMQFSVKLWLVCSTPVGGIWWLRGER
jgi:uncharacterized membrane protein YgdD (TMEM256/DUF423 family)